ncbi:hypothetical protein [Enterocloster clostridioformis]|uniref:hypothetical protein n=1 Tax=Enterocloster clostridioformis TaxID=1531 RepID=UPI00074071F7|nr:hypothetical protein [Enterocloster clostridioformis]CUX74308.1 hypothetical protein BN3589_03529 [Clostridium sp. C105KSO14]
MASIITKTDDWSFSVECPLIDIGNKDYVKRTDYEKVILKALDEVEKYKTAFENAKQERDKLVSEMQSHIDCLKAELLEVQCHSDKLKQELEMKDGTKMFDTLMENSSGEARELLSRHLYENLCCVELNQANGLILPSEPIDVASMLIKATVTVKTNPIKKVLAQNIPDEYETEKYSKSDLRQIAKHLLAYCKNVENED